MLKIDEAKKFLENIGMPKAQQSDICALSLLAMAGIKRSDEWKEASNDWIRIHDIIAFVNEHYKTTYAENSRETFRKQAMHRFRTAALIEDNGMATNSPNYRYRITEETLKVLQAINSPNDEKSLKRFLLYHEKLVDIYASKKKMTMMPVKINGTDFQFSEGNTMNYRKLLLRNLHLDLHRMQSAFTLETHLLRI